MNVWALQLSVDSIFINVPIKKKDSFNVNISFFFLSGYCYEMP